VGIDARGHDAGGLPEGGGAEHHPLLAVELGGAVLEQLRALLAPIAAPVRAFDERAVAVEGGEDVPGVDGGHGKTLLVVGWLVVRRERFGLVSPVFTRPEVTSQDSAVPCPRRRFRRAGEPWRRR